MSKYTRQRFAQQRQMVLAAVAPRKMPSNFYTVTGKWDDKEKEKEVDDLVNKHGTFIKIMYDGDGTIIYDKTNGKCIDLWFKQRGNDEAGDEYDEKGDDDDEEEQKRDLLMEYKRWKESQKECENMIQKLETKLIEKNWMNKNQNM